MAKFNIKILPVAVFGLLFSLSSVVRADSLFTVFKASLNHDSLYLQAKADYLSAKESKLAAWSSFFPQLSTSGSFFTNYKESLSSSFSVNASQLIFNVAAMRQVSVANAQVREAVIFLSAAQLSLMQRVSATYFDVISAHEMLVVMKQQLKSMNVQLHAVKERYSVGHATITDLDRVKATYDLYRSQWLGEKIKLNTANQKLSEISGYVMKTIPSLKFDFKPVKPKPTRIAVWVDKVRKQNFDLQSANQAVGVTQMMIGVKRGAYFPSVSMTGSYYPGKFYNTGKRFIYGLDVSFSAFQGGYSVAEVGKAQAQYQKALARRDAVYRKAISNLKSGYDGMLEGVEQINAERLAVESNQSALSHTKKGYMSGTQTVLDVLDQQNQLFSAQRTYVEGRIGYMNSVIGLEQAAGTLSPTVLLGIQGWFR